MAEIPGWLVEVTEDPNATETIADAATGASLLEVDWVGDFGEDGGMLSIDGGTPVPYATVDPDADTITLVTPLAADLTAPVSVASVAAAIDGTLVPERVKRAWVTVEPGGVAMPYIVDQSQDINFPLTGSSAAADAMVGCKVTVDDSRKVVVGRPDMPVLIPLNKIDTTGFPTVPTEPPAISPTPALTAGPAGIFVQWPALDDDTTQVDIYVATTDSAAVDESTLYAQAGASPTFVTSIPADGSLPPVDADTFVALVARNVAGSAAPSAWVAGRAGQVDPQYVTLLVDQLVANGVLTNALTAVGATIGGGRWDSTQFDLPGMLHADLLEHVLTVSGVGNFIQIVAQYLRLIGNYNLLEGVLTAANGVTAPLVSPRLSSTWTDDGSGQLSLTSEAVDYDYDNTQLVHYRGLWDDDTQWLTAASTFDGSIHAVDKATGDLSLLFVVPQPTFNNRSVYQLPANGTSGHTTSPGNSSFLVAGKKFTPTVGRLLVAVCYGATSSTTPDGWTAATDSSAVNHGGLYVWWKVATDSNTLTVTHGSANHPVVVAFYEFPTGATFVGSAADDSVGYTSANPTLSGLTGTNVLMAAKGIDVFGLSLDASGTWSTGVGEDFAVGAPNSAGADGYWATVGVVPSSDDDSFAPTCTITATNAQTAAEALTWAINVPDDAPDLPDGVQPSGGVVKVGTDYYTLVQDSTRDSAWYVYKFDSTGAKVSEWKRAGAYPNTITLGTDGTYLYTAHRATGTNKITVARYNLDSTGGTTLFTTTFPVGTDVTGLYVGAGDFGGSRFVITTAGRGCYVFNSTGTQQTAQQWTPAGNRANGLAWDGTRFHTLDADGTIWHYGRNTAPLDIAPKYTWYDSDPAGVGTQETNAGPVGPTFTLPARAWLRAEHDPPNDTGGVDDPNSIRSYLNNHRQPDLGAGVTSYVTDLPDTTGPDAPSVNGFSSSNASPGAYQSAAGDTDGPFTSLPGDGSSRVGTVRHDSTGKRVDYASGTYTGTTNASGRLLVPHGLGATPTGWINARSTTLVTHLSNASTADATNITVWITDAPTGNPIASTSVTVRWEARL